MISSKKVKAILKKAIMSNHSPSKLALSFAIGIFISFSPYVGGHTLMTVASLWLFRLNLPILLLGSTLNNPWTMVPFFFVDYGFGHWFVHSLCGWEPTWVISLERFFGTGKICFWSFFVGGNILGVFSAFISYPLMKELFARLLVRMNKQKEDLGIEKLAVKIEAEVAGEKTIEVVRTDKENEINSKKQTRLS
jgi:uncharacterized protein